MVTSKVPAAYLSPWASASSKVQTRFSSAEQMSQIYWGETPHISLGITLEVHFFSKNWGNLILILCFKAANSCTEFDNMAKYTAQTMKGTITHHRITLLQQVHQRGNNKTTLQQGMVLQVEATDNWTFLTDFLFVHLVPLLATYDGTCCPVRLHRLSSSTRMTHTCHHKVIREYREDTGDKPLHKKLDRVIKGINPATEAASAL